MLFLCISRAALCSFIAPWFTRGQPLVPVTRCVAVYQGRCSQPYTDVVASSSYSSTHQRLPAWTCVRLGFGVHDAHRKRYHVRTWSRRITRVRHTLNAMQLYERDQYLIQLLYRFKQLRSDQLQYLGFPDAQSTNPLYNTLKRLKKSGYVSRIEGARPGGERGGSGQYVWQLGVAGYRACGHDERYTPARATNEHTLAIADVYIAFVELERGGYLRILSYSTEPDCHIDVAGERQTFYLRPDLYIEWVRSGDTVPSRRYVEVDMGTQWKARITRKCQNYWGAYQVSDDSAWPDELLVLFATTDDTRATELRRFIRLQPEDSRGLYRVQTLQSLIATFKGALSTRIANIVVALLFQI